VFRGIFFDLDDTLFDRTAALGRWIATHVGTLDATELAWVIALDDRGRRPRLHFAAGLVARFKLQRPVTELAAAFPSELALGSSLSGRSRRDRAAGGVSRSRS
jgi:hypothetical protein